LQTTENADTNSKTVFFSITLRTVLIKYRNNHRRHAWTKVEDDGRKSSLNKLYAVDDL